VQLDAQKTGDYSLPMYFTSWTGPGLATLDTVTMVLAGDRDRQDPTRAQAVTPELTLRYGMDYEFQVCMMDHTGGGPGLDTRPSIPGPAPVATIPFRRWIRPLRLRVENPPPPDPDPAQPPAALTVRRRCWATLPSCSPVIMPTRSPPYGPTSLRLRRKAAKSGLIWVRPTICQNRMLDPLC